MPATAGPSQPSQPITGGPPRDFTSKGGPRGRYHSNLQKYGTPLPILLPSSPLHPAYNPRKSHSFFESLALSFALPIVPSCEGVWDPSTRSVIVSKREDMDILFRRGFFGKGSLSRSEPTWRARRIDLLKGGESSAAEKIREKRRLERKQFKIDRAAAMLTAAKAAEAIITSTQGKREEGEGDGDEDLGEDEDDSRRVGTAATGTTAATGITTGPSGEAIEISSLTPQTFLVRPTRPDANRNRGRNAFKRRPKPKPPASPAPGGVPVGQEVPAPAPAASQNSAETAGAVTSGGRPQEDPETGITKAELEEEEEDWFDEALVEEAEHLQLGTEEACFLSTALGVLRIRAPETNTTLDPCDTLPLFISPTNRTSQLHHDDPFLVSYAVYHYFRTLGWVVKPGIKFCCDWLLYRRGPVFSHAAFSVVVIPVYADPRDKTSSPFQNEDWYEERLSWKWMNTIMRVNSLVQKTVILVHVIIPAASSIPARYKLEDGTLDRKTNDIDTLLRRFTVSETSLQRFGPARRRD